MKDGVANISQRHPRDNPIVFPFYAVLLSDKEGYRLKQV